MKHLLRSIFTIIIFNVWHTLFYRVLKSTLSNILLCYMMLIHNTLKCVSDYFLFENLFYLEWQEISNQ